MEDGGWGMGDGGGGILRGLEKSERSRISKKFLTCCRFLTVKRPCLVSKCNLSRNTEVTFML